MKLLIIDRDGVINEESSKFVRSVHDWRPIEGSIEAIARASQCGLRCVVASNQSGLARGLFDIGDLNRIHQRMLDAVWQAGGSIEAIFFCPHGPDDGCACRKPGTLLLEQIADRTRVEFSEMVLIGDRLSDIEAARATGIQALLVKTGRGAATIADWSGLRDVLVYENLASAIDAIISNQTAA